VFVLFFLIVIVFVVVLFAFCFLFKLFCFSFIKDENRHVTFVFALLNKQTKKQLTP